MGADFWFSLVFSHFFLPLETRTIFELEDFCRAQPLNWGQTDHFRISERGTKVCWGLVTVAVKTLYSSYAKGEIQWGVRGSNCGPELCVECFLWQCPWRCGRTKQSWYECEPTAVCLSMCVCTLWHCHWSSLASCSVMQETDKDFIQLFLTHKHTTLCLALRASTKAVFMLFLHAALQPLNFFSPVPQNPIK